MKILKVLGAVILLFCVTNVWADVRFYTNEAEWVAAVTGVEILGTTPEDVAKANEVLAPPTTHQYLGRILTFDKANTGLSWSFTIETLQDNAQFIFSDHSQNPAFADKLSVGNVSEHEDDDWQLQIIEGPSLYACAVDLVENEGTEPDEFLEVLDKDRNLIGRLPIVDFPQFGFLGVVSDTPIGFLRFIEDPGDDDSCLTNFRFAVAEPLPLTGRIAFTSDRDGNEEIYLMNTDGSNQIRLTNHSGADVCPVFSPDGQTIAFFSNRSGSYRIYTMDCSGGELLEVPNSECEPGNTLTAGRGLAWSPSGEKLLFKPMYHALATIDLDGSNKTVLLTGGVGVHNYIEGVEWGPSMGDIYFNAHPYSWGYDQHIFHYLISSNTWTQITHYVQPKHSHGPKVSPDGSRIVFDQQSEWGGLTNIFTMDLDGSNDSQLTFDVGFTLNYEPDWIGETGDIVFSSNRSGSFQIWLMDSTGGNLRMLEGDGNNYAPSWTPIPEPEPLTGRIAYCTPDPYRLWVMNADGTFRYEVPLPYEQLPIVANPQWSADGSWLTFSGGVGLHSQIYIVRPDGSGFDRVTNGSGDLVVPSFSPDGLKIVFAQVYGNMYIINTDGTGLTDLQTNGGHPRWSPDGRYIVYNNWGWTYESDLFLYDLTTGNSTQITHHAPGEAFMYAMWSPDGTKLAVSVMDWTTVRSDIWVMNADGSDTWNLTADWPTSDEHWPSWSPDGQYIVFTSDISGNLDIWYSPVNHFAPVNITNRPEDEYFPAIGVPEPAVIEVTIDIKPGSYPNAINPGSNGVIPVAILTTDDFDAADVDPGTVMLAGAEVAVRGKADKLMARLEDVDEDGDLDLLVQVETQSDGTLWATGSVTLTAKTYDGQDIEGEDDVIIVPPGE